MKRILTFILRRLISRSRLLQQAEEAFTDFRDPDRRLRSQGLYGFRQVALGRWEKIVDESPISEHGGAHATMEID